MLIETQIPLVLNSYKKISSFRSKTYGHIYWNVYYCEGKKNIHPCSCYRQMCFSVWTQLLKYSCLWRFTLKIFLCSTSFRENGFFRTNIFISLFQVRWHFHSITQDPFPSSPQGHDNLNIVFKHSWFSLLPCVLNVSLFSPFLHPCTNLGFIMTWVDRVLQFLK